MMAGGTSAHRRPPHNDAVQRAQPVAAAIAAVICLALGVYGATRRPAPAAWTPPGAAALAPLRAMPVAPGGVAT